MSTTTTLPHPSWLQEAALKILGFAAPFWDAFKTIFASEASILLAQLAPIAIQAVTAQISGNNKGNAALLAATEQAKVLAIQDGINASTTMIQTAIQLAKVQLDAAAAKQATTVTTPAV